MARPTYTVRTGATALAANSTKSVILIPPASSSYFSITEVGVMVLDTSATLAAVVWELYAVTSLGSPAGTSFTPVLIQRGTGSVAQTGSTLINLSAEATTVEVMKEFATDPKSGLVVIQYPLGREPQSFSGTSNRLGLRYVN